MKSVFILYLVHAVITSVQPNSSEVPVSSLRHEQSYVSQYNTLDECETAGKLRMTDVSVHVRREGAWTTTHLAPHTFQCVPAYSATSGDAVNEKVPPAKSSDTPNIYPESLQRNPSFFTPFSLSIRE